MRKWPRSVLISGGLLAVTFAAFAPALSCGFTDFDDPQYVVHNRYVRDGLSTSGWIWAWTALHEANWHPLTWLSLQLDATLFGDGPTGFHCTNVLLHAANVILLFLSLTALTRREWPSALTAALFAVHPLRVESVAWVSERKDVLSAFFGLLSLLAYAYYVRRPNIYRYSLIGITLALSLLAKPMLVTLPFLFLVLDWWPLGRFPGGPPSERGKLHRAEPLKFLLLEKIPLLVLVIVSSVVTLYAQGHGGTVRTFQDISLPARLANVSVAYVTYLFQMIWPFNLAALYPFPTGGWHVSLVVLSVVVLLLLSTFAVLQRQHRPYFLAGWLWYLGTLVPVIGLVQVGPQAYADRYTYLPLVGIFLALAWELAELVTRNVRVVAGCIGAGFLAGMILLTWIQIGYWRDNISLWTHAIDVTGDNNIAYVNLTAALVSHEQWPKCIEVANHALRIWPDDAKIQGNAAIALINLKQPKEALALLEKSLQLAPDILENHVLMGGLLTDQGRYEEAVLQFRAVLSKRADDPQIYSFISRALRLAGKPQEALESLYQRVRLTPKDPNAYGELILLLENLGNFEEALVFARRAVELQPDNVHYRLYLAVALAEKGQESEVQESLREMLRLDPMWPAEVDELAWRLATSVDTQHRNGKMAVDLARLVCQATENRQPRYLDTLAAAYAEAGQFSDARDIERKAMSLASEAGHGELVRDAGARLRLYEQGKAFQGNRSSPMPGRYRLNQ